MPSIFNALIVIYLKTPIDTINIDQKLLTQNRSKLCRLVHLLSILQEANKVVSTAMYTLNLLSVFSIVL